MRDYYMLEKVPPHCPDCHIPMDLQYEGDDELVGAGHMCPRCMWEHELAVDDIAPSGGCIGFIVVVGLAAFLLGVAFAIL